MSAGVHLPGMESLAPTSPPSAPSRLTFYEKKSVIGKGSFGNAFLAICKEDGKQYVIKEVPMSDMTPKQRADAFAESQLLSKMNHPNIIFYKENFIESDVLYIVMEFADGGDLHRKLKKQRNARAPDSTDDSGFPEEMVLDMFVQICLAIKHVHDRKILHRDLKAQNIFLTRDGKVKLGDFGIAKRLAGTWEKAKTSIGTPYYLSPEICENQPYNNKSDIWAMGCILYEMCTLKHPFDARNIKGLVLKILKGVYKPVSRVYSDEVANLIAILLTRNPDERPNVNQVLELPLIKARVTRWLPPEKYEEEFSHTVLHNVDLFKSMMLQGPPKEVMTDEKKQADMKRLKDALLNIPDIPLRKPKAPDAAPAAPGAAPAAVPAPAADPAKRFEVAEIPRRGAAKPNKKHARESIQAKHARELAELREMYQKKKAEKVVTPAGASPTPSSPAGAAASPSGAAAAGSPATTAPISPSATPGDSPAAPASAATPSTEATPASDAPPAVHVEAPSAAPPAKPSKRRGPSADHIDGVDSATPESESPLSDSDDREAARAARSPRNPVSGSETPATARGEQKQAALPDRGELHTART